MIKNVHNRWHGYLLLFGVTLCIPLACYYVTDYFGWGKGDPLFFGVLACQLVLNYVYGRNGLQKSLWAALFTGLAVTVLSIVSAVLSWMLFLRLGTSLFNLSPLVIGNAVSSVIWWETSYRTIRYLWPKNTKPV